MAAASSHGKKAGGRFKAHRKPTPPSSQVMVVPDRWVHVAPPSPLGKGRIVPTKGEVGLGGGNFTAGASRDVT